MTRAYLSSRDAPPRSACSDWLLKVRQRTLCRVQPDQCISLLSDVWLSRCAARTNKFHVRTGLISCTYLYRRLVVQVVSSRVVTLVRRCLSVVGTALRRRRSAPHPSRGPLPFLCVHVLAAQPYRSSPPPPQSRGGKRACPSTGSRLPARCPPPLVSRQPVRPNAAPEAAATTRCDRRRRRWRPDRPRLRAQRPARAGARRDEALARRLAVAAGGGGGSRCGAEPRAHGALAAGVAAATAWSWREPARCGMRVSNPHH